MMKELREELKNLSKERIFKEFQNAMKSKNPQNFFEILLKSKILDVHFKEINELLNEKYNFTMKSLTKSTYITNDEKIRFAVLVQNLNIDSIEDLAMRIALPKKWIKCGKESVLYYKKCKYFNKLNLSEKVEFIENINRSILGIKGLKIICISNNDNNLEYNNIINCEKIGIEMLRKINGKYIMDKYNIKPNKLFNEILKKERMNWLKNNYT